MNWPVISGAESFWDRALANGHLDTDGEIPCVNGINGSGTAPSSALDDTRRSPLTMLRRVHSKQQCR